MSSINTAHPVALRYLLDDSLYLLKEDQKTIAVPQKVVDPIQETVPEKILNISEIQGWGQIGKGIYFIHYSPNTVEMLPEEMDAFIKTLSALGKNQDHVSLLNLHKQKWEHKDFLTVFSPENNQNTSSKVIFLGDGIFQKLFPNSSQPTFNQPQIIEERKISILNTSSFSEMFVDIEKKKAFWVSLKSFLA